MKQFGLRQFGLRQFGLRQFNVATTVQPQPQQPATGIMAGGGRTRKRVVRLGHPDEVLAFLLGCDITK